MGIGDNVVKRADYILELHHKAKERCIKEESKHLMAENLLGWLQNLGVVSLVVGQCHIPTNLDQEVPFFQRKRFKSWGKEQCTLPFKYHSLSKHSAQYHTMGKVMKITRRSIHAFFQSYHTFASTVALLAFPVSAATLLSESLTLSSSPILRTISSRLRLLFEAAGFPASSQFFYLLNFKLSQAILTFISTLPFTLIFLILAKASVVQIIREFPRCRLASPPFSSLLHLYPFILLTYLSNSLVILSVNAAIFSILFLGFNIADVLHLYSSNSILVLSVASVILYSIVIANTAVVCNLAIVISATENCGGYLSILKALMLIRGKTATAITLALPANLGMAAIEALFQYRVMRQFRSTGKFSPSVILEAFLITYIYSLLIILDTIITCMFLKICKSRNGSHWNEYDYRTESTDSEPEAKGALQAQCSHNL